MIFDRLENLTVMKYDTEAERSKGENKGIVK